jgi:hypothetical protein
MRGSWFFGGARSPRPHVRAGRKARQVMIPDGRARGRWAREDNTWVGVVPSLRACGARPSAKPDPHKENERLQRRDARVRRDPDVVRACGARPSGGG